MERGGVGAERGASPRSARRAVEVSRAPKRALRRGRHRRAIREATARARGFRPARPESRRRLPPRRDRAACGGGSLRRSASRRAISRGEARGAGRPQAGAHQGGLPGRRSRWLRRRCAIGDRVTRRHGRRSSLRVTTLSRRGRPALLRRRLQPRRVRRHRSPVWSRQNDRRPRRHGEAQHANANPHRERERSAPVARRDPRQDGSLRRPSRRVQRTREGDPADHALDVPVAHLPAWQDRGVSPLQAIRGARLGAHRLRRSPPAAGGGVPRHCRAASPPTARSDRDAWCAKTAAKTTCSR